MFAEVELREAFGVRVYDAPHVPIDRAAYVSSRMGIRRMIERITSRIEREVDPMIIGELKDKVRQLRSIRNDMKRQMKEL